jgi:hypothetical protein
MDDHEIIETFSGLKPYATLVLSAAAHCNTEEGIKSIQSGIQQSLQDTLRSCKDLRRLFGANPDAVEVVDVRATVQEHAQHVSFHIKRYKIRIEFRIIINVAGLDVDTEEVLTDTMQEIVDALDNDPGIVPPALYTKRLGCNCRPGLILRRLCGCCGGKKKSASDLLSFNAGKIYGVEFDESRGDMFSPQTIICRALCKICSSPENRPTWGHRQAKEAEYCDSCANSSAQCTKEVWAFHDTHQTVTHNTIVDLDGVVYQDDFERTAVADAETASLGIVIFFIQTAKLVTGDTEQFKALYEALGLDILGSLGNSEILARQVRKMPSWPRIWANVSLR